MDKLKVRRMVKTDVLVGDPDYPNLVASSIS